MLTITPPMWLRRDVNEHERLPNTTFRKKQRKSASIAVQHFTVTWASDVEFQIATNITNFNKVQQRNIHRKCVSFSSSKFIGVYVHVCKWWVMLIEDLTMSESAKPICSEATQWFEICGVEWWMVDFFYTQMTTVCLLTDLTSETNHFVQVKCWKYACCACIY